MDTPIYSFLVDYKERGALRLHMPGHKGMGALGVEALDITEIKGADSLYEAEGIIRESERNAGALFGAHTFYSTEGSSLSIRAMVQLTALYAKARGKGAKILAFRNVHKAFLSAVALVNCAVEWLYPNSSSYMSCGDAVGAFKEYLCAHKGEEPPTALYVTSPDYLGNIGDVMALSELCHREGMLLLVDNAHGAYLKFVTPSCHPMDFGADMCCDSAHKTLPAITGTAYLHISKNAPALLYENARAAMSLFASTSPSYLMLASLDLLNKILSEEYGEKLACFFKSIAVCKQCLSEAGHRLIGDEPMKITIATKYYGYSGTEFAEELRKRNIECEFCDPDFAVLMPTPSLPENIEDITARILSIEKRRKDEKNESPALPPKSLLGVAALSVREALTAPSRRVRVEESEGRILADPSVGCPPAVPILVSGEVITKEAIKAFLYYGVKTVRCVEMKPGACMQ